MARDFSRAFYQSPEWKSCREAYAKSVSYLCEDCLAKGLYKPGKVVHHITELTPDNITDPSVTMGWQNLRYVCQDCHADRHARKNRRYVVDENGNVYDL